MGKYFKPIQPPQFDFGADNLNNVVDFMNMNQQKASQENRIRINNIETKLKSAQVSDLVVKENNVALTEMIEHINDLVANAFVYEMDEDGTFTSKKKDRSALTGRPTLSDKENFYILEKINELDKMASSLKQQEAIIRRDEPFIQKELQNPSGDVDVNKSGKLLAKGLETGYVPASGSYIVPTSEDPDAWTREIPYLDEQKIFSVSADEQWNVYRDAPIEYKHAQYMKNMEQPRKQRGVIDRMVIEIQNGTEAGKKALYRIIGSMNDYNPNDPDQAKYEKRALQMLDNYQNGDYTAHEDLIEGAKTWGELDMRFHENIAKGFSVKRPREVKEGDKDPLDKPTQRLNFGGASIYGKDLRGAGLQLNDIDRIVGTAYIYDEKSGWKAIGIDEVLSDVKTPGKVNTKGEYVKPEYSSKKNLDIVSVDDERIYINKYGSLVAIQRKGNEGLLKTKKQRTGERVGILENELDNL